jgi:phosphoserine phosphatase
VKLIKGNWVSRNFDRLRSFVEGAGRRGLAVFDWDNTSVFGDIGDAFSRDQIFRLDFRLTRREFEAVIPETAFGIDEIDHAGGTISLPILKEELVAAYRRIEQAGFDRKKIGRDPSYADFTTGLLVLNQGLETTAGIGCRFSSPWITRFLKGFSVHEIETKAAAVFREQCRMPIRARRQTDSHGSLTVSWTEGMRVFPEMRNLMKAMKSHGFEIGVVTATNSHIVSGAVEAARYPVDRLVGQASETEAGRLNGYPPPGFPVNWGEGKAENIRRSFKREPVFAAGDSDGDCEMLTGFPETELRLLIHRGRPGRIRTLVERAGEDGYLIQEVDCRTGKFIGGRSK